MKFGLFKGEFIDGNGKKINYENLAVEVKGASGKPLFIKLSLKFRSDLERDYLYHHLEKEGRVFENTLTADEATQLV
ncbi:MAG: hypothetical protein FWE36_08895 [Erysipelotrichales bacterium]|nr:hypothetical protein [Erysipelotrichales bacterium]